MVIAQLKLEKRINWLRHVREFNSAYQFYNNFALLSGDGQAPGVGFGQIILKHSKQVLEEFCFQSDRKRAIFYPLSVLKLLCFSVLRNLFQETSTIVLGQLFLLRVMCRCACLGLLILQPWSYVTDKTGVKMRKVPAKECKVAHAISFFRNKSLLCILKNYYLKNKINFPGLVYLWLFFLAPATKIFLRLRSRPLYQLLGFSVLRNLTESEKRKFSF